MRESEASIRGRVMRDLIAHVTNDHLIGKKIKNGELRKQIGTAEPPWKCPECFTMQTIEMEHFTMELLESKENANRDKIILQLHGGGYVGAMRNAYRMFAGLYNEVSHGMSVLTPDYRVAPEHPYPAALDDALESYQYLLQKGYEPGQIMLAGESAGGGLIYCLCLKLKELGMEEAAMNCHTLADATPILKAIKEKTGTASFPVTKDGVSQIPFVYDGFGAGLRGVGVRYDDQETKVVKIFEQQDVMDQLKIVREWFESGIINADAANLAEGPTYKACFLAQGWSSAAKTVWGPNMGKELVAYTYGPTILSNDSVLGSVNFVSVNSEHPDKALAFLNLMNTDSKVRDAFYYGLEGDNFTYTEDGRVHKNPDSSWGMAGYTQGTFFAVTPTDDVEFNQWDEVKELN